MNLVADRRQPRPYITPQSAASSATSDIPAVIRFGINFLMLSIVFGSIFGIRLSDDFSLSLSLIALYFLPAVLFFYRMLAISPVNLTLYVLVVSLSLLSFFTDHSYVISTPSFMYLVVMYLPFGLVARRAAASEGMRLYSIDVYLKFARVLAALAIFQFVLQFAIKDPALFNIGSLLPPSIVASGGWNTANSAGSFYKANGFFQLEPSTLSLWLGIAILLEIIGRCRPIWLGIFALAVLLSFSGSGIFLLAIAFLLPTRLVSLVRAILLLIGGSLLFLVVDGFLVDGYYSNRLAEFSEEGSSGYARFVAPTKIVAEGFSNITNGFAGNGAGAIRQAIAFYPTRWEIHDPTWAKLLYEYGLLGGGTFMIFITLALLSSQGPKELKIALLYGWLAAGGLLLNPVYCATLYGLTILWPRMRVSGA